MGGGDPLFPSSRKINELQEPQTSRLYLNLVAVATGRRGGDLVLRFTNTSPIQHKISVLVTRLFATESRLYQRSNGNVVLAGHMGHGSWFTVPLSALKMHHHTRTRFIGVDQGLGEAKNLREMLPFPLSRSSLTEFYENNTTLPMPFAPCGAAPSSRYVARR